VPANSLPHALRPLTLANDVSSTPPLPHRLRALPDRWPALRCFIYLLLLPTNLLHLQHFPLFSIHSSQDTLAFKRQLTPLTLYTNYTLITTHNRNNGQGTRPALPR
jgi:hypothetical protein